MHKNFLKRLLKFGITFKDYEKKKEFPNEVLGWSASKRLAI